MGWVKQSLGDTDQLLTQSEYFPEEDSKGPHITQGSVEVVEDALRCHPFQWQEGL